MRLEMTKWISAYTDVECYTVITRDREGFEVLSKFGGWIKV